jgi:hypothetical protein
LVEQGTFNPKVAGSIPARPITERDPAAHARGMMISFGFWLRVRPLWPDAPGGDWELR